MNTQGETLKSACPPSAESCRGPFHGHLSTRWQSAIGRPPDLAASTGEAHLSTEAPSLFEPLQRDRVYRNRSPQGGPLALAGTTHAHGLSVRIPVPTVHLVEVRSPVPMVRLEAVIGVDDAVPESHGLRFSVIATDHGWQKLFESPVLKRGQPGQRIAVELGGPAVQTASAKSGPWNFTITLKPGILYNYYLGPSDSGAVST